MKKATLIEEMEAPQMVLYSEDTNAINSFRANVESILETLNELNEVFPIQSVEEIPTNVSVYIFERAKERIPKLRADLKVYKNVSLSDYFLPDDLVNLRAKLEGWNGFSDKSGLQFIVRGKDQFELDREKIDAHCENFRQYISGDQVKRMEEAKEQCKAFNRHLESGKIHPMLIHPNFKSPLVRLTPAIIFEPNMNYVFTGELPL